MASNAVELAVGYITIIPEMRGVAPAIRQALGSAQGQAGQTGNQMGTDMSGGLSKTLLAGLAGVGLAAGALIGKGVMDGVEAEVSTDKLAASLGATGPQAAKYGKVAGQIYAQAYGENLGEVTTAVDAVASTLKGVGGVNLDDGSLDRVTKKALDFSAVYGTDVADSAQTVNQLMSSGLAKTADEGFDLLTKAYQQVPAAMREELPALLNEYGTFFSSIGFSGQEAFGLLVNASDQGAIGMDKVGDAIKEFGIRATDIGDTGAQEALASMGLSGQEMANQLLAGGDTAQGAFTKIISGLQNIKDPAAQAAAATALFGTPLEDLDKSKIPGFLASLTGAGTAMEGFAGSADQMGATLADNAATKIEAFKRTISQGLTNLAGAVVLPALSGLYNVVSTALEPIVGAVKDTIALFIGAFTGAGSDVELPWMNTIIDLASRARGAFDEVKGGVTAFAAAFRDGNDDVTSSGFAGFLEGLGVTARNLYDTWQTTILPVLQRLGEIALNIGQTALPILWGAFTTGASIVGGIVTTIADLVGWFTKHQDVVVALGSVLAVAFLPTMLSLAGTLAVQAGLWIAQTAALSAYIVVQGAVNVATKAWAAVQWLLNAALNANPISLIVLALAALVAGIVLAYRNSETFQAVIQTVWDAIKTAISFAWESVIKPVFEALKVGLQAVGDFFGWVWNSLIKPAWDALGAGIQWVWQNVISPAWDGLKTGLQAIGDFFGFVWYTLIKPVWDGLGAGIQWVIDNVVSPAFETLKSGLQGVKDFFVTIVDGIKTTWDGVKEIVRAPIEFLVNTIYNKGIVPAWNNVAGFIGLDDKKLAEIQGFATGGIYPGYTPGRDTGVIAVGGGEAIMRPEWTRAVGSDYVDNANAAARSGGVGGVRRFLGAFADGGIVESMRRIVDAKFPGMQLTSGLRFTDNGYHSKGMAADFSDGYDDTPGMQQLSNFIADNYASQTIQLIHSPFDRNIGDGQWVGDGMGFYTPGTMAEHRNHVHWAVGEELGAPSGGIISRIGGFIGSAVDWARNKVADLFEKPIRAIGDTIPEFPGSWGKVPREAYNKIADAAIAFVRGKADEKDSSSGGGIPGSGPTKDQVRQAFAAYGWDSGPMWDATDWIVGKESSWNPTARNASSGAFGLFQFLGSTKDTYLPDENPNPGIQGAAGARYIKDRYGDPLAAKSFWEANGWYAKGGIIPGYSPGIDNHQVNVSGGEAIMRPEWTRAVGSHYVHAMNKVARTQGVGGVSKAMGGFADGGVFDPQKYLFERLGKYGTDIGEIGRNAVPEILGLEDTPFAPNHRYQQAVRDTVDGFTKEREKLTKAAESGTPSTGSSSQTTESSSQKSESEAQVFDFSIHFEGGVTTVDVEELKRQIQQAQRQGAMAFSMR